MRDNSNKDSEGDQDVITTLKNLKTGFVILILRLRSWFKSSNLTSKGKGRHLEVYKYRILWRYTLFDFYD